MHKTHIFDQKSNQIFICTYLPTLFFSDRYRKQTIFISRPFGGQPGSTTFMGAATRHRHISACQFAPPKGLSGKYILFCTCLNWQADLLNTTHFYMENSTNTQKYTNNATKLKRQNDVGQVKLINYLTGKVSLKTYVGA